MEEGGHPREAAPRLLPTPYSLLPPPITLAAMEWSNADLDRYSRHLLLDELGSAGVERIRSSRILVVGDVEPTALRYLCAGGVAHLALAHPSARVAATLPTLAGEGEVAILTTPVSGSVVARYDALAIGGQARFAVAAAWYAARRPAVVVATASGQAAITTLAGDEGCPACLDLPAAPPLAGPLAPPLQGLAGVLVATELLKLLAGVTPTLDGDLLGVDGRGRLTRHPLTRRTPCAICG